jgi:hypothetical protein
VHETAIVRNGWAGIRMDGGTVLMANDTVSSNQGNGSTDGGGIWMYGGTLIMLDSTVAYNTGRGITAYPGDVPGSITMRRSVVALNSVPCIIDTRIHTSYDTTAFMCVDSYTSTTLGLGPLTSEAGTLVHPLLAGSPLIDAGGRVGACPAIDQRDYVRPAGITCDVGAYEKNATPVYHYVPPATTLLPLRPTNTSGPTALAAVGATNTPIILATVTGPGATVAQVVPTLNAFCRKGPGTLYDQVSVLYKGLTYDVIGRDSLNKWWQVQGPGNKDCWVGDANVGKQGSLDQIPVVQAPALPGTPSKFVNSYACDPKAKTLGVSFNWAAVPLATGYRIYRNGSLAATVDASQTSYHDDAPVGQDLVYELEAFNSYGVASRVSTPVPACK